MRVVLTFHSHRADSLPMGLASLAANLPQEDARTVAIVDGATFPTEADCAAHILRAKPRVVGLSFLTLYAEWALALTRALRAARPKLVVVHGGAHPSAMPDESLASGADVVVIGEGEQAFAEILARVRRRQGFDGVRGVRFRAPSGQAVSTPPRPLIQDLGQLRPPRWDLLDLTAPRYHSDIHAIRGPALPIMASRGCPHDCTFCAAPFLWRRRVRYRPLASVMAEIDDGVSRLGFRAFHFYDDSLLVNARYLRALCERIIETKPDLRWCCLAHVRDVNRNAALLPLMRRAGCLLVELGIESLDERVLAAVKKRQTKAEIFRAIDNLQGAGIQALYLTMAFNEGETIDGQVRDGQAWSELVADRPSAVRCSENATPFPGSRFFATAAETGLVFCDRWNDYSPGGVSYLPNSLLDDVPALARTELSAPEEYLLRSGNARAVYELIDGSRSVRAIANVIAGGASPALRQALKEVARLVVFFAQRGLIRGARAGRRR
jgi:anaerobic magnesium-protoporphyrin IX monomethyl ester cyclase